MRSAVLLIATVLCLLPPAGMQAQEYVPTPVSRSTEKVRGEDGNIFYSHVVLEKQTLFSISQAYGVTVDEIEAANPQLNLKKEGLKKGSILLIPAKTSAQEESAAAEQPADEFITHTVRWFEDIDDIAKKYNVSAELIMQVNHLSSRKLKIRQKLLIPKDPSQYGTPDKETDEELPEEEKEEEETTDGLRDFFRDLHFPFAISPKNSVNAVLLLPMKNGTSLDFYSGFLMAVKELAKNGIGTDLSVYDVSNGSIPVSGSRLSEADVVFGPIAPADLAKVLTLTDKTTGVISPLDQKAAALTAGHRNLVQAPAPQAAQYEDLVRWILEDRQAGDKVVLISEKKGQASELKTVFQNSGLTFHSFSYSVLDGRNIISSLSDALSPTGVNRIVIDSENEAFVQDLLRNLSLVMHKKYEIVTYAPSKIRSFETIDSEYLHSTSLHVSLSYYIDYSNPATRDFLLGYRALFKTEPNQFAFQGYDLGMFFIKACAEYGDAWLHYLEDCDRDDLFQTNFRFREAGERGPVNAGIRRIVFNPDYSIGRIR